MSFSPQTPLAGEPVIIDTDPGIDDALALVFAAASSMRIEGVTIVHGNGKDVRQLGTVDVRARLRVWLANQRSMCVSTESCVAC